ncbi:MAG: trigger factor [Candidatus Omnitrophota bacterium]
MKIETKKIDGTKRELSIELTGEAVKNKFEDVFKRIAQEAKVPGFRPGRAPRDILEKNFSGHAHEQVLKELVPDVYNQAIAQEKLDVVELPQINDVQLDRARLSFKATVEVSPEIQVKDYKGIKVNFHPVSAAADEVKRNLDALKESHKLDNLDDGFARGLGYPNLAELEKALERQIFLNKENQQRQRIENEIIDTLMNGLDFKLPQSLVDRQLQDLLRQAKIDLALKGMPREKIQEQEKEILKSLEPQAKNQVRVYLVLAEIAKQENIAIDDHMPRKVMELLLREAEWVEAA